MADIRAGAVVIDVNDLDAQAQFWAALLEMDVATREAGWCDLGRLGGDGPVLSLQLVPERKTVKNRLHLDWLVEDFYAARRRALSLGAVERSARQGGRAPWQVFADPEGNEFCLCTP
jgi:catechol-2,3-dioxygenase